MIEETGYVFAVEGDLAWVSLTKKSVCGSCSANKGCGTAALHKVLGKKQTHISINNSIDAKVGDSVILGLHENALIKGVVVIYGLPILLMLFGAILPSLFWDSEVASILSSFLGLLIGLFFVWIFSKKTAINIAYQPVLIRKVHSLSSVEESEGVLTS